MPDINIIRSDLAEAIGRFVADFATLEHRVWQAAPLLLGRPAAEIGHCLLETPGFGPRLAQLEQMAENASSGSNQLLALFGEIRKRARFRAILIHGRWAPTGGQGARLFEFPLNCLEMETGMLVTPASLEAECLSLQALGEKLINLSSPETHSSQ